MTDRVTIFREFIDKYCQEDLAEIIKQGRTSLQVNFSKLNRFNTPIAEEIAQNPEEVLKDFDEAVKEANTLSTDELKIRLFNFPKSHNIRIRNLRSKHLQTLIIVEGLIRQASDVRPKTVMTTFECPGCNSSILVPQNDNKLIEPSKCNQCARKGRFRRKEDKLVDVQMLMIEEDPEMLEGGEQPKRIRCFLDGDLLDPVNEKNRYPGNKIKVIGILKEVPVPLRTGGASTKYDIVIEANNIETVVEDFSEVKISKEDERIIKELASAPNVHNLLVNSVAPSIWGHERVKEACVLQLFGGVKKLKSDGTQLRGDIHVFLVGDPGAGKSLILRYISTLAPKARYIAGKGTSAAGITASVVKDEFMGGWTLEAGTLVLANKGIACIDELDKMSGEDSSAMHEAMEQQCFDYDTIINFADGSERKIGEYVEELFRKHQDKIIEGKDCFVLKEGVVQDKLLSTDWENVFPTTINRVSKHKATELMYKITFTNGRSITVTPEHPVFCIEGGKIITKQADELVGSEAIPVPRILPIPGKMQTFSVKKAEIHNSRAVQHIKLPSHNDPTLYRMVGYLISEGSRELNRGKEIGINFTNKDPVLLEDMDKCVQEIFGINCYAQEKIDDHEAHTMLRYISRELAGFFEKELPGTLNKSNKKQIPPSLMCGRREDIAQLLLTLFEGDGHVSVKTRTLRIGYTSKSKRLVEQIQDLLLRFEISSSITYHKEIYKINITGYENISRFAREIGFLNSIRRDKVEDYLREKSPIRTYKDVLNGCNKEIINLLHKYEIKTVGMNKRSTMVHDYLKKNQGISRNQLQKLVAILSQKKIDNEDKNFVEFLKKMAHGDIGFERIKYIEQIKPTHPWTYDVTIEPNHTFISQGVVLHNTVTISKANIQATLRSETSVLAAANPKFGRFDPYSPIANQINMASTLLNRFDLIFIIRDVPNISADEALATHVLELQGDIESKKGEIDYSLLRKYIAYAKRIKPKLSAEARQEIKTYYVKLRNSAANDSGDVKAIPISPRQLQALVRLSEASARIRLSKKVTIADAKRAIDLLHSCMTEVGTDPETGKFDIDRIASGITATQRSRITSIKKIIDDLESKFGKMIPISEVVSAAEENGFEKGRIEEIIESLKKKGDIFEPRQGMIQKIS